jgi:hypothetical protein
MAEVTRGFMDECGQPGIGAPPLRIAMADSVVSSLHVPCGQPSRTSRVDEAGAVLTLGAFFEWPPIGP